MKTERLHKMLMTFFAFIPKIFANVATYLMNFMTSNSGAKMIKCSAIEIWSRIPSEIENKSVWHFLPAKYNKYLLLGY